MIVTNVRRAILPQELQNNKPSEDHDGYDKYGGYERHYNRYDSYGGYIRHIGLTVAKVARRRDFLKACKGNGGHHRATKASKAMTYTEDKTAAGAITNTRAATDIGSRTFTRATAVSKFLAAQGFQRIAHLRRVAHGLTYLHLNEWRTNILEAISRVGALFEDQRSYIFRVERLTMERL